jgi:hypothetical protein
MGSVQSFIARKTETSQAFTGWEAKPYKKKILPLAGHVLEHMSFVEDHVHELHLFEENSKRKKFKSKLLKRTLKEKILEASYLREP